MQQRLAHFVTQHALIPGNARVLAGVSGGVDSVAMAHLLHQSNQLHGIAHVHFGLRGADADADQALVEALALRLNVPFYSTRFNTRLEAEAAGESIQMAARRLRFDWFDALLNEHGFAAVAIASHLDDQAETMLLNLLRGTGVAGLHGILPKRDRVIHPVLFATKAELAAYACAENLVWREDASNQVSDYQRNRLRLEVMPMLEAMKPGFATLMQQNALRMHEAETIVARASADLLESVAVYEGDQLQLQIDRLADIEQLNTHLYYWLRPYGFNRTQTDAVAALMQAQPGKQVLSATHKVVRDRAMLLIVPKEHPAALEAQLHAATRQLKQPIGLKVTKVAKGEMALSANANIAQLDAGLLQFPLTVRPWQHGDAFQPLGMEGTKKLSDFLIDQKVPLPSKAQTYVLCSAKDIVWVAGHRIDHRYRITDATTEILRVELAK